MDDVSLLYFQSPACGVCHALRPKLEQMLAEDFPQLVVELVDIQLEKEKAASHQVFVTPVLILQVQDKEHERFVRAFSVGEVKHKLERIHRLMN